MSNSRLPAAFSFYVFITLTMNYVPQNYSEFRTYYIGNESCDDGSYEHAEIMRSIEREYPEWYAQLCTELV